MTFGWRKRWFLLSPRLFGEIAFHCQQAAEKAFKGFLTWHGRGFRKTHDLEEIGAKCADIDPTLRGAVDEAVGLTDYAWKFRYPGVFVEATEEVATDALATARLAYATVLERLPSEVRP